MKKFLNVKSVSAIILCFILAFALCACQNTEPSSSSDNVTSTISSPSLPIDDETQTDTTVDNSSDEEISSETTIDTPSKDNQPPATSSGTNTESSNTQSGTTDKTPTPSQPTTESTPSTTTPTTPAQKTAKELIVGKWRGSADMAPMFSEMMGYDIEESLLVSCDIEYTSNGNVYEVIDRTSLKTAYTKIITEMLNATMAENNLTKADFEASIGQTFDEYVNSIVQMAIDTVPQTITGTYKFEGNDLYARAQGATDFEKFEYRFNGENELIVVEGGVPITYTRIG